MEKRSLYIVLTRTNTTISKLIRLITSDEFTHAAISLDEKLEHMYSFGRRNAYNPFIGRFTHEDLNQGGYKFSKVLPGIILEIEVPVEQYEEAKNLLDIFIANSHRYKYNYRGLFYSMLGKPIHRENRFLCSEFVYYILKESGITDLNRPGNLVRPQNFLDLTYRVVYQGDLREFKSQLYQRVSHN